MKLCHQTAKFCTNKLYKIYFILANMFQLQVFQQKLRRKPWSYLQINLKCLRISILTTPQHVTETAVHLKSALSQTLTPGDFFCSRTGAGLTSDNSTVLSSGTATASNSSYNCWEVREYLPYFYFAGGPAKLSVLPLHATDEDLFHC